jgi:hypothetical protein
MNSHSSSLQPKNSSAATTKRKLVDINAQGPRSIPLKAPFSTAPKPIVNVNLSNKLPPTAHSQPFNSQNHSLSNINPGNVAKPAISSSNGSSNLPPHESRLLQQKLAETKLRKEALAAQHQQRQIKQISIPTLSTANGQDSASPRRSYHFPPNFAANPANSSVSTRLSQADLDLERELTAHHQVNANFVLSQQSQLYAQQLRAKGCSWKVVYEPTLIITTPQQPKKLQRIYRINGSIPHVLEKPDKTQEVIEKERVEAIDPRVTNNSSADYLQITQGLLNFHRNFAFKRSKQLHSSLGSGAAVESDDEEVIIFQGEPFHALDSSAARFDAFFDTSNANSLANFAPNHEKLLCVPAFVARDVLDKAKTRKEEAEAAARAKAKAKAAAIMLAKLEAAQQKQQNSAKTQQNSERPGETKPALSNQPGSIKSLALNDILGKSRTISSENFSNSAQTGSPQAKCVPEIIKPHVDVPREALRLLENQLLDAALAEIIGKFERKLLEHVEIWANQQPEQQQQEQNGEILQQTGRNFSVDRSAITSSSDSAKSWAIPRRIHKKPQDKLDYLLGRVKIVRKHSNNKRSRSRSASPAATVSSLGLSGRSGRVNEAVEQSEFDRLLEELSESSAEDSEESSEQSEEEEEEEEEEEYKEKEEETAEEMQEIQEINGNKALSALSLSSEPVGERRSIVAERPKCRIRLKWQCCELCGATLNSPGVLKLPESEELLRPQHCSTVNSQELPIFDTIHSHSLNAPLIRCAGPVLLDPTAPPEPCNHIAHLSCIRSMYSYMKISSLAALIKQQQEKYLILHPEIQHKIQLQEAKAPSAQDVSNIIVKSEGNEREPKIEEELKETSMIDDNPAVIDSEESDEELFEPKQSAQDCWSWRCPLCFIDPTFKQDRRKFLAPRYKLLSQLQFSAMEGIAQRRREAEEAERMKFLLVEPNPHGSARCESRDYTLEKLREHRKRKREEQISEQAKLRAASHHKVASNDHENIISSSRSERASLRGAHRTMQLVDPLANSALLQFSQLTVRQKKLKFLRSAIHDWGIIADEVIEPGEMIIEYLGEIIRNELADLREKHYEEEGIGSSYLFRVDDEVVIDATKKGNISRFLNHSCEANCQPRIIMVNGKKRIVVYSRIRIEQGDELCIDYKMPLEPDNKIPCLCGAPKCKGYLN